MHEERNLQLGSQRRRTRDDHFSKRSSTQRISKINKTAPSDHFVQKHTTVTSSKEFASFTLKNKKQS